MRIWDLHPGYLNRRSLLGEHRELHGMASIIVNGKKGYARHPETLRWMNFGWALNKRHQLLSAEMKLRGFPTELDNLS
ncbi:pyrimidine dimer DNA glycosylase/endonuclease V [uncultured Desulfobacter sp.]|uniref:pyrimidine dimer DNA glycosylase/endonuclease V n=1 Tax=uncultured Desulfobacter sp. TaxID=240139 RepID=UPI0029C65463|nr:pyrimidine dimer DNA glycosylase/endonuclease V [uncultured Desulfobacter sp.]